MTTDATRASRPYRAPTVYRSGVKVIRVAGGGFVVRAHPVALHEASVYPVGREDMWRVKLTSVRPATDSTHIGVERALKAAGDLVSRKAGEDWRAKFTGPQRVAMGQMKCPAFTNPGHLCEQTAQPGSVWCGWHPKGKELKL